MIMILRISCGGQVNAFNSTLLHFFPFLAHIMSNKLINHPFFPIDFIVYFQLGIVCPKGIEDWMH